MQDANKIIDNLNREWTSDMAIIKKRIAILLEENERLKTENEQLKSERQDDENAN
ncbi:hypothetical protein [Paraliobacillus salinarum]|uniref:hypothetical protein n=1 Tax=Paraliobacillus salinarum TaxID=1158996 RepID=UPI0015F4876A|nr:hypothetical protein [Paraliobacillus salinarum]